MKQEKHRKMTRKILKKGEAPEQFHTELYDKITKIEAQVLQRIQRLKTSSKSCTCQHFIFQSEQCEPYSPNVNYYDKFWKRFLINEIGKKSLQQQQLQYENFKRRLDKIDNLFKDWQKEVQPVVRYKKRRSIVKAQEEKRYFCGDCGRGYHDNQSLNTHINIKHFKLENQQFKKQNMDQIYEENEDQ